MKVCTKQIQLSMIYHVILINIEQHILLSPVGRFKKTVKIVSGLLLTLLFAVYDTVERHCTAIF